MSETSALRFTREHEWVKIEGGNAVIGITDYAQKELGDIVFVELPELGSEFESGKVLGTIESVKTVSDVYTPFSGKVVEVNGELENDPGKVNRDPYGSFIAVLKVSGGSGYDGLMDEAQYKAFCEGEQ